MEQIISLYDNDEDRIYEVNVSAEDARCPSTDSQFATRVLNAIKLKQNQHKDEDVELSIHEKENEDSDYLYRWSHPCILLLLQSYQEIESKLAKGKVSQKKCWDIISTKLKSEGHNISGPQIGSKLRSLKKTYKSIIDHNSKSGNDRREWQYFELMNEIFEKRAWSKPVAVASSSGLSTSNESDSGLGGIPSRGSSIAILLAKRLNQKEEHEKEKKNAMKRKWPWIGNYYKF